MCRPPITVRDGDVVRVIREERQGYDAILLDVDNGPEGLTRRNNNWLYTIEGLARRCAIHQQLTTTQ